jgi:branched-subunit amino acid aminotransferase/4-amino-4-deoxychorismate lyase
MSGTIAWIAASAAGEPAAAAGPAAALPHPHGAAATASLPQGAWGDPGELALPLADRGLLLADGLFETVLLEEGRLQLLEEHLERWRSSAELLAMAPPPDHTLILPLVAEAIARSGIRTGALRLNWSRGCGGRGLDLPAPAQAAPAQATPAHRFWLQLTATAPQFEAVTTWISREERRNAASRLSRCKSFAYTAQVQARREAQAAGAHDALLLSSHGQLCCGSAANLLVLHQGRWTTPPLASGCLPGVMRGRALRLGRADEAPLEPSDLKTCEGALLINSLGCRPIHRCDGTALAQVPSAKAEQLWRELLKEARP